MAGTITLLALLPVSCVLIFVIQEDASVFLTFLPLIPIFGLVFLLLFIGLLLLRRPLAVSKLARWVSAPSVRASASKEVGVKYLYWSAVCLVAGTLYLFIFSGHDLSGIGRWLIMLSIWGGLWAAKEAGLWYVHRR